MSPPLLLPLLDDAIEERSGCVLTFTAWRISSHVGSPYKLGLDGDLACDKHQGGSGNEADRNIGVSEETVSVETL